MSERPDTDTAKTATTPKPDQPRTTDGPGMDSHPMTTEKPGTGTTEQKTDDGGSDDEKKGKSTFYGRDQYPDGYVMHHSSSGEITLDNPDGTYGRWSDDEGRWVDMAGHPMPEGWDGGHKPGTAFGSGTVSGGPSKE
jgi:hypothetical protein